LLIHAKGSMADPCLGCLLWWEGDDANGETNGMEEDASGETNGMEEDAITDADAAP